jgi:hypothetical protein
MRHTTNHGHHGAYDLEAAMFWIFGGIIVAIAFRDFLPLLAVAFAIVAAAWWVSHNVEHRVARTDAPMASVTHFRPASSGRTDLKRGSSRRGHRAA